MATITFQADVASLDRDHQQLERLSEGQQRRLTRLFFEEVARTVVQTAPKDTHRYVRGWQMAFNAVGLGPFVLYDVRPTTNKSIARLRRTFLRQEEWYRNQAESWYARYRHLQETTGFGKSRQANRERKGIEKVRVIAERLDRVADRARSEAEKLTDTSILILGRKTQSTGRVSELITVRAEPKGGTGRIFRGRDGVVVMEMRNREPHASIVEAQKAVVTKALARAQAIGLVELGRRHSEMLARGAA